MNPCGEPRSGNLVPFRTPQRDERPTRDGDHDVAHARRHLEDLDMLVRVAARVARETDDPRFSAPVRRRVLVLAKAMERGVDALAVLVEAEDAEGGHVPSQGRSRPV